jgi:hypothetical protein
MVRLRKSLKVKLMQGTRAHLNTFVVEMVCRSRVLCLGQSHVKDQATLHRTRHLTAVDIPLLSTM